MGGYGIKGVARKMNNSVIDEIKKRFDEYKLIYNKEYDKLSEVGKTLLENSIHLSIFTIFESFLKITIKSYIKEMRDKLLVSDIESDLSEKIIFGNDGITLKSRENFEKINNIINNPLNETRLESIYKFKFLHGEAIENHYNKLFEDMLGEKYFFNNLKLTLTDDDDSSELETKQTLRASKFIENYTKNVRNNIAHQNYAYKTTVSDFSVEQVCYLFLEIIKKISIKFFKHNQFNIEFVEDHSLRNVMNNF